MLFRSQTHLPTLASNRAQHGRTIIGECAASPAFVGATTRRVERVKVFNAFFPPHSETAHRFQPHYPLTVCLVATVQHWRAPGVATSTLFCTPVPVRGLSARCSVPAISRAAATPPATALADCPQKVFRFTHGRCRHTLGSDTPLTRCLDWPGNSAPDYAAVGSVDTSSRTDASASSATLHSSHRLGGLILESPSLNFSTLHSFYP